MRTSSHTYLFICVFSFLFLQPIDAQRPLQGRVVEAGDKPKGVQGLKVAIAEIDDDITSASGEFKLHVPEDWKQATISLKNSSMKIIKPALGEVRLPATAPVEIMVCGAEKKRLMGKVTALEIEVRKLKKERSLSQQQVAAMHSQMLDTILHYENKLADMEGKLVNGAIDNKEKSEQIAALERQVAELERQLQGALEERYRMQKKQFDQISAAFNNYADQSKNLRDLLRPEQLDAYYLNPGARQRLYDGIEKYNQARNAILEGTDGWVAAVAHYWEDAHLPDEVEAACEFILKDVHEKSIHPLEFSVNGPLKEFLSQQATRQRASKQAKEAAEHSMPALNDKIGQMEHRLEGVIGHLAGSI